MRAKWAYDPNSPASLAYEKKLKEQLKKISNPGPVAVTTVQAVQTDKAKAHRRGWDRFFHVLGINLRRKAKLCCTRSYLSVSLVQLLVNQRDTLKSESQR